MKSWQLGLLLAIGSIAALKYFHRSEASSKSLLRSLIELTERELDPSTDLPSGQIPLDGFQNILVVPDVHGDTERFIRTLWLGLTEVNQLMISYEDFAQIMLEAAKTGVYPEKPLSDGSTILVQLGDIVDRGPSSILCLRVLWSIERVVGWRVVSLYGNHEVMSSTGVRSEYIHPTELAEFGGLTHRYVEFGPGHAVWDKILQTSLGMAVLTSVKELKSTLFVHAGVEPIYLDFMEADWSVDSINAAIRTALSSTSRIKEQEKMLNNLQSPIWTRLFAEDPDSVVCDKVLPFVQEKLGVNRIVIGHTPQEDHLMKSRCGGKIFLTDCGMSRWLFNDEGMPGLLVFKVGTDIHDFETITSIYYDPWTSKVKVQSPIPVTVKGDITAALDSPTNKSALV
jgi:hypothetical protein